ncbi:hypothetical protein OQA88_4343 [Cercophora sp. LCS_1]
MTSPIWFQNLAGATFLSPTGACKPFDAKADGYCRGEGVACVFLKKMSKALEDGDLILGTIRSTAVYQNDNCTPIFVPNAPSLSGLFEDVVRKAGLRPKDITLVEAHGTGTPVGDPAEYESIRKVLGGTSVRTTPLPVGSVKGLIGHTECTSGVVALIKVILAIHHGVIPPQASFQTPSPRLKASPEDMLEFRTEVTPWTAEYRAALINNYGASGSNASLIVSQAPKAKENALSHISGHLAKHAFWFTGLDDRSIREYAARFKDFLASQPGLSLSDLSFNVYRQSNRTLPQGLGLSCGSFQELDKQLTGFIQGDGKLTTTAKKPPRPVILCFGGQISKCVGLDRTVYESVKTMRTHLELCHTAIQSLGLGGLYPCIFEKTPIDDPVKLQLALFSLQYSCARCWMDGGVEPVAVVGHSFGELTALCIAGILSLRDALRAVAARAQLVRDAWGSDRGAMMAVEGKLEDVEALLERAGKACPSEQGPTVACYNGTTSFTVAGSTKAIDAVGDCLPSTTGVRGKKLSVSNAFHSALVEPLVTDLRKIARGMNFRAPTIRWERATEQASSPNVGPAFFASHMRDPVFANHAFQRLHREFPSAIWLEAGSNSTITKMANKALGSPAGSHFADINITSDSASEMLADAFVNLWREGLTVPHWGHHHTQAQSYSAILLPPYQFEKSRHWLALKRPQEAVPVEQADSAPAKKQEELPTTLYTFVGYQDEARLSARFRVNTMIKKYEEFVSGHLVAQTAPICPATLEVSITIEALLSLRPDFKAGGLEPEVQSVENLAPICIDPSRMVWLDLQATTSDFRSWHWQMTSTSATGSSKTTHVKGQVTFRPASVTGAEIARYERLVTHARCIEVLNGPEPDDVLQGRNVYKVFSEIVDYSEPYQGLQKLVGKGVASAGRVVKKHSGKHWLDTHLSDAFSQVGGFWVNCMTDRAPSDMYIAAGFESWIRRPPSSEDSDKTSVWDVMATHVKASDKAYTTDIFIFEAESGVLREAILGINYVRMPKSAMSKLLTKLAANTGTTAAAVPPSTAVAMVSPPPGPDTAALPRSAPTPPAIQPIAAPVPKAGGELPAEEAKLVKEGKSQTAALVVEILAELSGADASAIKLQTQLGDIGIDSLVGMEMIHDLEAKFECSLDTDQMAEVVTVLDVVQCVQRTLGIEVGGEEEDGDATSSSDSGSQSLGNQSATDTATTVPDTEAPLKPAAHLSLEASGVLSAFGETKKMTDQFITDYHCSGYMDNINPKQTQLCISLVLDAFEKLDCNIRTAKAGEKLRRISYAPQHGRLVEYLYDLLEKTARLIDVDGDNMVRTAVSTPHKPTSEILDGLIAAYPDHSFANRLAFFCGSRLVEVLQGSLDGVKLIFGNEEGRQLVSGLYGDSLLNKLFYKQMEDFLTRLVSRLPRNSGPLKILEMGAGTGGTTKYLVPLLARLGFPVEYTFTDLAPSFVGAARRQFKAYPFMKFRAHDIEQVPADDLIGTQHIVIASNAVHATHSLTVSLHNIRKALRPDGFLMMLEMTETLPWVDIIFGLLEGWWLFDDGRQHAIAHQSRWEQELHSLGYGHVDWTDGHLAENHIQRIIIAMSSGAKFDRLAIPDKASTATDSDTATRAAVVDAYVEQFTAGFTMSPSIPIPDKEAPDGSDKRHVLVTGATGSLGAHLVAELATQPDVHTVICLNRPNRTSEAGQRQRASLDEKGLNLAPDQLEKLRIMETDTSKARLGLTDEQYQALAGTVTAIVHNAWPMSGVRPVRGFESQFAAMRNLIDLARDAACHRPTPVTFQFISSIAVAGHYPLWRGNPHVPEERVGIESVLPNGYGDAKFVCERMLDKTLHAYPDRFRTMCVRLGQVAGSSTTGYWNALEHFSFLVKSSQTLRALPDFTGLLSWTPVDVVARTLADLVLCATRSATEVYPVYHVDNPVRQPWEDMIPVLARALAIPTTNVVPFAEWVRRVRHFPGSVDKDNPAYKLVNFLDGNFLRMSCGGLLLDTAHTREHSSTLAAQGPVSHEIAVGYIRQWQRTGFLAP